MAPDAGKRVTPMVPQDEPSHQTAGIRTIECTCKACGRVFSVSVPPGETPTRPCPGCGSTKVKQTIGSTASLTVTSQEHRRSLPRMRHDSSPLTRAILSGVFLLAGLALFWKCSLVNDDNPQNAGILDASYEEVVRQRPRIEKDLTDNYPAAVHKFAVDRWQELERLHSVATQKRWAFGCLGSLCVLITVLSAVSAIRSHQRTRAT